MELCHYSFCCRHSCGNCWVLLLKQPKQHQLQRDRIPGLGEEGVLGYIEMRRKKIRKRTLKCVVPVEILPEEKRKNVLICGLNLLSDHLEY